MGDFEEDIKKCFSNALKYNQSATAEYIFTELVKDEFDKMKKEYAELDNPESPTQPAAKKQKIKPSPEEAGFAQCDKCKSWFASEPIRNKHRHTCDEKKNGTSS